MKKSTIITLLIVAGFIGFVAVKLSSNKKIIDKNQEVVDRTKIATNVNVVAVEMGNVTGNIVRPAVVQANEKATIAPSASGKIESLNIDLGTRVSKGQTIGTIDTKTMKTQLKNLELTFAKLKRDYERNQELYKGNAISETNLIDSKFAMDSREIEIQQLKQQISDGNILSPISGTITDKKYLKGEFISIGTPIATVVDVETLKIYVYVNEVEVQNITKNQVVSITASAFPDKTFTGKVSYVAPTADDNFNYKIEIIVNTKENKELKAGTYINANFKVNKNIESLMIPKRALVEGVKNAYVYVKKGEKAEKRTITVGQESGEKIQVVSGLSIGELIVVDGQINIVDGSLINTKTIK